MPKLTISCPDDLHIRIRQDCFARQTTVQAAILGLIEAHWPGKGADRPRAGRRSAPDEAAEGAEASSGFPGGSGNEAVNAA